ncbi:flagellar motor protein MotB [Geomonas sp. Red276]
MRINKKILGWTSLAIVVIIAGILIGLPPLVKYLAIKNIDEKTGRKSTIADLSINPFTLRAEIKGFRLQEKGSGATFTSFSSASVSISPLSLPKRAVIVREIHVVSPYVHIVRDAVNHYNFSDLVTPSPKEPKKEKEKATLFSLNNIIISKGSIDFEDSAISPAKNHRLRGIEIALPFISDLPYLADRYVTPRLKAEVNGSPFEFQGRLKPMAKAVEATLDLHVKQVDIPFYLGYLPFPPPVKVVSGQFSSDLEVGYRVDGKKGPDLTLKGAIGLDKASAREYGGAPLASVERLAVKVNKASLFTRVIDITSAEMEGWELYADRDRAGKWNFQKLHAPSQPAEKSPAKSAKTAPGKKGAGVAAKEEDKEREKKEAGSKETPPLDLRLAKLAIKTGKLHFSDQVPAKGFRTELQAIELEMRDFSLRGGHKAPLDFGFKTARGEKAVLKGDLALAPTSFAGQLTLSGIPLKDYYPYLSGTLAAPISGTLSASSQISYDDKRGLVLQKTQVKGERLAAPFGQGDGIKLAEAVLSGISLDLKQNKAVVERVDLKGGNIALTALKGGGYTYQTLLTPGEKPASAGKPAKKAPHEKKAPPFSYRVGKISGTTFSVRFTDKNNDEEPVFNLNRLNFSVAGVTGPKFGAMPITLSSGYGSKGSLAANGVVAFEPVRFKGKVDLHRIPIRDFDPYIPEDTNVFIADGTIDTSVALDLVKGDTGLKGSFSGSLGVNSFYCQDLELNEDLLKWESLQMDQVSGTLAPFTLAINEVALSNFYSRVIVEKDGTLNLQHLRDEQETPATAQAAAKAPAPPAVAAKPAATTPAVPTLSPAPRPAPAAVAAAGVPAVTPGGESPAQPHPVRIDTITIQGGTMAFTDRHLQTTFDTTFYNLGGRVSGLSSQAKSVADVDLRGNLENHSPLSIKGVINPLRGDLFLDLKIAFNDIELSPFTPYSDTYLGYNVDKGKLFLDLAYKIDRKALTSQNKVFIDQFTFGKSVDSPQATKLPVKLAVALLKDRKGEIHLDLPVTGRTDDPQFSVWGVVWQVLKNLLVKAATSPMALLGSMFGGGHDFTAVAFPPGSDLLAKNEQDKLDKLAKALNDRPALTLEMSGYVDRDIDAEGYRNEMLMKKMKGEKFRKLVKEGKTKEGQTQEQTVILPEEYSTYLKAAYQKEKFPKPRTALGFLKDLPDEEMRKLILTHTVVGNNELQALARERTAAVKTFLTTEGKIQPERLFEVTSDIFKPSTKGGVGGRVEFTAKVK